MRIQTYICSTLMACSCLLSGSLFARDNNAGTKPPFQVHPLSFIENKGQITDQAHNARTDIQYKLPAQGMNIFIGNAQLHYEWIKNTATSSVNNNQPATLSIYRLDVSLIGADPKATIITEGLQADCEHYTLSQTAGKTLTAHTYNRVTYKNVYPNIDWVLYTSNNQLKYDFVVRPGGHVSDIRLAYEGATSLTLQNGLLTAATPMGNITEQAPYSYDGSGKPVSSAFNLHDNILSFSVDNYTGTLTVDPLISWVTYYGGTGGNDRVNDVACDLAGNIYIAGETISADNIATTGSHQNTYSGPAGYFDAFVAAFSKGGQRLWGSYFGDTASDYGTKLTCDAFHNVYLTGSTYSQHNIATPGAYQTILSNGNMDPDAFLAKFNATTGDIIWSTYFGGSAEENGYGLICDPQGNIYIAGNTYSTNGIASSQQVYHPSLFGYYDTYLAKFDSSGNRKWGTYFGGSGFDLCSAIAMDRFGAIYIAGKTNSNNYVATPGSYQDHLIGTQNTAYLAKFDTAGFVIWSTYYGSSTDANTITTDANANVYIGGETTSSTDIATPGSFQSTFTPGGFNEGYIAKFNASGNRLWATYVGGSGTDYLNDLSCDPAGNIYAIGSTSSTNNIATPNAYHITNAGENAFVIKFRNDGVRRYGTYFGGASGYEVGNAITNDANGNLYFVGATGSDSGVVTQGAFETIFHGPYTGYLAAFKADTNVYVPQPYTDTIFCSLGATFNLPYAVMNHFNLTNIFTAQLSDSTGSFASPVAIGAVLDSASGVISCTFPAAAHGNHYRIRVVASSPADTSADDGFDIVLSRTPSQPTTASSNSPICTNDTLRLSATDTTAGVTYRWTKPDGTFVYGQNPALGGLQMADSGIYYVAAMLNGCPSIPDTVAVALAQSPAKPTDTVNSPLCQNDTLFVSAFDTTPGVTYSWTGPANFTNPSQSFTIPSIQLSRAGRYIVTATANGCTSIPDTVNVVVNHLVVPSAIIYINPPGPIAPSETIALTASITNGGTSPTIQWYKNNVALPGGTTSPFYANYFVNGDIVSLVVHSSDPCAQPDSSITFSGSLGVSNTNVISGGLALYPNPNNGTFRLTATIEEPGLKQADVLIQNMLGQLVYQDIVTIDRGKINASVTLDGKLPEGVYMLHLKANDKDYVQRFTLRH